MTAEGFDPMSSGGASSRQWLGFVALIGGLAAVLVVSFALLAWPALTCGCTPVSQAPDLPSPIDGVVVAVDAAGLNDVRGFDLRTADGRTFHFEVGRLENPAEFPSGHLSEHQATSSPVRVHFHEQGGTRTAYRLEDAPG